MATIYEIAEESGFSVSTVARVLRNENKGMRADSVERSKRIREVAEQLGYTQNWRASAFAKGKTCGIGLVTDHSEWLFYGLMGQLSSILSQTFCDMGYHLVVIPMDSEGRWKELVSGGRVDGIVVLHHYAEAIRKDLEESGLPILVIGDSTADNVPTVLYDDVGAAYAATRHLIELGHRRIAMYARDVVRPHCSVDERGQGYESAMKEAGLGRGDFWFCSEEEVEKLVLRSSPPPTAVLCYGHIEAEVIYKILWQHGLSVPQNLSVIAFNEMPSTARMTPPLSSICFDYKQLASTAMEMLVNIVEGRDNKRENVMVSPLLNLRASTAPPSPEQA